MRFNQFNCLTEYRIGSGGDQRAKNFEDLPDREHAAVSEKIGASWSPSSLIQQRRREKKIACDCVTVKLTPIGRSLLAVAGCSTARSVRRGALTNDAARSALLTDRVCPSDRRKINPPSIPEHPQWMKDLWLGYHGQANGEQGLIRTAARQFARQLHNGLSLASQVRAVVAWLNAL